MKLKDSLRLSLNSIVHRRLRAWLTLLGIVIGVAAVVSTISIGDGAQASLSENLSGFGADIITVSPGGFRAGSFGGAFRGGGGTFVQVDSGATTTEDEPELTARDATIIRGNPNVLYVNEIVSGRGEMVYLAQTTNVSIKGVNPVTWLELSNFELASGRFLGASGSGEIVIGNRLANDVFKKPLNVGGKVNIEGKAFTVVGILEEGSDDATVYMSYKSAWDAVDVEKNTFTSIEAKAEDSELVAQVTEELEQSLRYSRHVTERTQDFSVSNSLAFSEQISETLGTVTLFLGAIAGVSLLVGAVGIANSMFTSVLEKTKEIGIMKALGATEREVLEMFVIESGLFGFVGGVIGAAIGFGVSILISSLTPAVVSAQLMIIAVVMSTIIGVISGIIPARSASKLRPVEALRYE
ncbi:MAG: ABC transporter permease [archaeon]|nr:ABC transporter permease [archaeon]